MIEPDGGDMLFMVSKRKDHISRKPKYWPQSLSPWPWFCCEALSAWFISSVEGKKRVNQNTEATPHRSSPKDLHSCTPAPELDQMKTELARRRSGCNEQGREGPREGKKLAVSYVIIPTKVDSFLLFNWVWTQNTFCLNDKDTQCSRNWDFG